MVCDRGNQMNKNLPSAKGSTGFMDLAFHWVTTNANCLSVFCYKKTESGTNFIMHQSSSIRQFFPSWHTASLMGAGCWRWRGKNRRTNWKYPPNWHSELSTIGKNSGGEILGERKIWTKIGWKMGGHKHMFGKFEKSLIVAKNFKWKPFWVSLGNSLKKQFMVCCPHNAINPIPLPIWPMPKLLQTQHWS